MRKGNSGYGQEDIRSEKQLLDTMHCFLYSATVSLGLQGPARTIPTAATVGFYDLPTGLIRKGPIQENWLKELLLL
jgi:hypothetical protein